MHSEIPSTIHGMMKIACQTLMGPGSQDGASPFIHITPSHHNTIISRLSKAPPMSQSISFQKTINKVLIPSEMTVSCMEVLPSHHLHRLIIIHLSDTSRLIVKISPSSSTLLLRYELDLLEREAETLLFLANSNLPVPQILKYEPRSCFLDSPFLLTSYLPGLKYSEALPYLSRSEKRSIEAQLRSLRLSISQYSSSNFGLVGYPRLSRTSGAYTSWREAFTAMMESVLWDGEDVMVNIAYFEIREVLKRLGHCLDEVIEPNLVILGLGKPENVLIDRRTNKVVGLLDLCMAVWGDPAMGNIEGKTDAKSLL